MNPAITSPVPAKDEMGMDYLPVYTDAGGSPEKPKSIAEETADFFADESALPKPEGLAGVTLAGRGIALSGVQTSAATRESVRRTVRTVGRVVRDGGTYVCMEGPQFSTRAESELYRSWGADIIGMTNLQEAKLAREAELCFATLALATDYDCWKQGEHEVKIEDVLAVLNANVAMAKQVVHDVVPTLPASPGCGCGRALEHAIITDRAQIPARVKRDLAPIIGRYVPEED